MAIKRIIGEKGDGPGLVAFDVRNKSDKRELYISDLPNETNTLIFRLQNIIPDKDITLSTDSDKPALEIIFPTGIFDVETELTKEQVQLSKWNINRNESLLNFDATKQENLKTAVQTLQEWKFLKYDKIAETPQGQKIDIGNDLKTDLSNYFTGSLKIKTELKELFEKYLEGSTKTPEEQANSELNKISNFPQLAALYERIAKLNEQIEANIKNLVTFRAEFQLQSEQSKSLLQKVIKDAIETHLGKMSKTSIFLFDEEKVKAIELINEWFEQLKLDDNLIDMLSEHQKTVSNWIIKTELKDSKQHITITAADLESIRLKPYEYFVLEINDFKISKEATIANNIEIKYPNAIIDGSNTAFKNKFSQTTSLDVISHAGKQLPLHVALIPNQKLINDESENTIKINLTNTGLDPMVIPLSGLSIFMDLKQESGHFPTAFIEKDRIKNVIVQAKNFPSKSLGSTDVNAKNATVVWEEQENISLQPNDQFTIELSKIQTKLPEGTAPFTIRLKNIAGFRDKDFGLVVKRELFKLPKFKIVIVNFSTNSGNYEYKKSIDIGEYAKYQLISVLADKEVAYLEVKNQELIIKTTRTQDVSVTLTYINKEFY